jgi:intracellular multiplication protein IcmK
MQKFIRNTALISALCFASQSYAVVDKRDYNNPNNRTKQSSSQINISSKDVNVPAEVRHGSRPDTQDDNLDELSNLNSQLEELQNAHEQLTENKSSKNTKRKRKSLEDIKREDAFQMMVDNLLPLSPDEILKVRKLLDINKRAAATPPNPPPTPNFSSTLVNLEPGSFPPVIRLSAGFVSSLLFIDSTGAPWPIAAYSLGDPQTFNIQWDQKSNTLFIQSQKEYAHANMAIQLAGLNTPVMLTLVSGQKNVDFRIDMQVTGRGPNAKALISADKSLYDPQANPELINILDGIPPKNSVKLNVSGRHGDAWVANNRLYFRTKLTLLSPAWTSTVTSPDGTRVYEMMPTPNILASGEGKTIDIKLTGM